MTFETTPISDLLIIHPVIFEDSRGYFFEAYNQNTLANLGNNINFVQDNQSFSGRGTVRGLHLQNAPFAQTKLVRVLQGEILDVAVDLRTASPTYGQHFSIRLSDSNRKQLLIPHGFAHGFSVLSEVAVVLYKCDQFYNKESEAGIRFDDDTLNINWEISLSEAIVSEKDLNLPAFSDFVSKF